MFNLFLIFPSVAFIIWKYEVMLPCKTWTMQRVSPDPHIGVKNTDIAAARGRLNCSPYTRRVLSLQSQNVHLGK